MDIQIAEIDRSDDNELAAYWEAGRAADVFERPHATFWPLKTMTVALRGNDPTWRILAYVARSAGQVVGQCQVVLPQLDNQHLAYTGPLVPPAYRNQGVGTALLDTVIARCRDEGRTHLHIEATRPYGTTTPSAGWSFLEHRGFTPGILDVHRILPLPIPDERLAAWADEAAPRHQDYRLLSFADSIPDEYVDGFCDLQMAFNSEAPMGDLDIEPEVWTKARLRANEDRRAKQGTWSETTLAVAADGSVAGLSELTVTDEGRGNCMQGGTLVLRPHRGHRLGMALKVANLQSLQARTLSVPMVHSWNAEENDHMGAINAELGFQPVEEVAEFQRRL